MRITTKGIGAHDQDLEVKPLTLLVGPNGSGKSKLAEAIRMVALGYVPSLGKRPQDLAVLMHGESMSVEMTIEGGRTIRRTLERRDTGYTAAAEASWMRQGKPTEISKAITKLFGDEEQDVAECLDIRELLAATPNQRAARMEQLLNAGRRSPDEIADAVARLWIMRLADTTEDRMPAEYMKAFELIPQTQQPVVREVAPMLYGKIKESGITGAVTWANVEKRDAAEGLKKKNAAAEELRKRAAQVPEPDERDVIRLEGEKNRLLQQLGAVRQARADYDSRTGNVQALKEQIEAVEERAGQTERQVVDAEAVHGKALKELRERHDQVLEKMSAIKLPPEEDAGVLKALEGEVTALEEKLDAIQIPETPDFRSAEAHVEELEEKIKAAKDSPWAEVLDIAKQLLKVKSAIERARRLEEIAREHMGAPIDGLEHELDLAKKQLAERLEAHDKANELAVKRGKEKAAIRKELDAKRLELDARRTEINTRRRQALQAFEGKRNELSLERQKLDRALGTHQQALETARNEKAVLDRHLASLRDRLRGAGELPAEPPSAEPIVEQIRQIETELAKLVAARATHTEIHQVLDAIEAAKAGAVVYTAIEWALQRQREIEISSAGGPLLRFMGEFLRAAGRKETPFIRASQGSCAIGWKRDDGREIQIQALSGGEWVLFAAALTSAVILCRKSALKILLVEAGETDAKTLSQLLEGIQGVNRQEVMTAVVMSPRAPSDRVDHLEAWDVVRITEGTEAAAAA